MTSQSRFRAARVAAFMTALSPGASPPPVLSAIRARGPPLPADVHPGGWRYRAAPAVTPAPAATNRTRAPAARRSACRPNAAASAAVCMCSSSATLICSTCTPSRAAQRGAEPGARGRGDDRVDVRKPHRMLVKARRHRLPGRRGESLVQRCRLLEPQDVPRVGESDCRRECFGHVILRSFTQDTRLSPYSSSDHPHSTAAPAAENGKCSLMPWPGSASLATTSARRMARPQEPVDDL